MTLSCLLAAAVGWAAAGRGFAATFVTFPKECSTVDAMAVDAKGRLVIAAPNLADDSQPGALYRIDKPGDLPYLWVKVPVNPKTGHAVPMGICFDDKGALYVCDNQKRYGEFEGRILRLTFKDDRLADCETVAWHLQSPNGCTWHKGSFWFTQSSVPFLDQGASTAASMVYRLDGSARNVKFTNSREDVAIVAEIATENRFSDSGANGIAFGRDGRLYVTHFGDGSLLRIPLAENGHDATGLTDVALTDFDYHLDPKSAGFAEKAAKAKMRSPDGLVEGPDGCFYIADFSNNKLCKVTQKGEIVVIDGEFNHPSAPIFWQGKLLVANFNLEKGRVCTLTEVPLDMK